MILDGTNGSGNTDGTSLHGYQKGRCGDKCFLRSQNKDRIDNTGVRFGRRESGVSTQQILKHLPFPGGRMFRVPYTALGAFYYGLRDTLGI